MPLTIDSKKYLVAVAQSEAIVESDPMPDDIGRKAVVLVSLQTGTRHHCFNGL
jgi:hypothetical protein